MIKTQIQLPNKLYKELKEFSAAREWSLAETLRRGAEQFLQKYPSHQIDKYWSIPSSSEVGWKGLEAKDLRAAALDDMEPDFG